MTIASVTQLLRQLGLDQYVEAFEREQVDWAALHTLSDADLRELGLPMGPRSKLKAAIAAGGGDRASQPEATPTPSGVPASDAERRQLTVLFCDLVGSTELSQRFDPEQYRELVSAYQSACAEVIARYEGHIAQYLGDGLLVYFGYPVAHEEDAQRGVRAGLAIVDSMSSMQPYGTALHVRIGIHTGLVVIGDVGSGSAQEQLALGDTPNLAARLQGIAAADTVVVSEATHRLCSGSFQYLDLGVHALKGFAQPVRAWRAVSESRTESRFAAQRGDAAVSALVGRDEELHLLMRRWELTCEGEGQVVLLSGEPGIGKSRLVLELGSRVAGAGHALLHFQCSPFHTQSALYPIVDHLTRAASFSHEQSAESRLQSLEKLLGCIDTDARQIVPLFADLLGLPAAAYPALNMSPQKRKESTLEAIASYVEGAFRTQATLIVFEDAHWIDPTTREALDLLVRRVARMGVMILVTFRPEFVHDWNGISHVTSLSLNRLGRRHVAALVEKVTAGRTLPQEVLTGIISKTDGVPLFVEELTKAILETGIVQERGDHYDLTRPLSALSVPATLQDSLMARLDRLAPVKEVAQVGACIGREFDHELLARVCPVRGDALDEALSMLSSSGLISRYGVPPASTYVFKHALVRDAAYDSLLKSRRAQLHGAIAHALETDFGPRVESEPEVLAFHFSQAGATSKAVQYWLAAGRRSLSRMALPEAISQLQAALSANGQLGPGEHRDRSELGIRVTLGTAYFALLGWVAIEVYDSLEPARILAHRLKDDEQLVPILYYIWFHQGMRGRYSESLALAGEIRKSAEETGDARALVTALMTAACARSWVGDFVGAKVRGEELLGAYRFERDSPLTAVYNHDPKCLSLVWAGTWLWALGYPDQARDACLEQLAHARGVGHAFNLMWALSGGSMGLLLRRETALVREWLVELRKIGIEQAMPIGELLSSWWGGYTDIVEGKLAEGYANLVAGISLWEGLGALHLVPYQKYHLALALGSMDRTGEALSLIDQAIQIIEKTGHRMHEAEVYRVQGELLRRANPSDIRRAEASLRKALEVARSQSAKGWELRTATSLARLWREHGRGEEGLELLSPIYAWFTEGFDTKDLREAKTLLEELRG